ncbi:potassium-transporting ATPase subunit KdpC [Tumebacillus lipolyticus]|uniref:Potassium-transporting ATPase KdpC subunit n=1 Tax=Tumebacillus lipolyticus TaxID=1280370 RepID=A0ABW4ZW41_9BACL
MKKKMTRIGNIGTIIRLSLLLMLVCGLLYPLALTGVAQVVSPEQANGSLIYDQQGEVIGSELIGQSFADPSFFQSRVSSINYDGAGSGSNNYAPSNPELKMRVQESIAAWQATNPDVPIADLPSDLLTNSGSGLDPHITPAAAEAQIPRISKRTGVPEIELRQLVEQHTEGRELGLFGSPRVNVLKLNLDLQKRI